MVQAANTDLKLVYEGSVKQVYSPINDAHHLWFYFTDDYSVFDWGKMPDTIANKGRALTLMGEWFFQELAKRGVRSHFSKLVRDGDKLYLEVMKADVHRPTAFSRDGQVSYGYPAVTGSGTRLVPLEVVFRFGMPTGSSLKGRLEKNPAYAAELGLSKLPKEGEWLERPVLEFFTKLEPKDRLLTREEAFSISTLSEPEFAQLQELALRAARELFEIFKSRGIELWDGKFEFIIHDGELLLADSIGPDELRLIYKGLHLSKEIIREHYRGSEWELALKEAQKLANERGQENFQAICVEELKQQPKPLPSQFKNVIDHLYMSLVNHVTGSELFRAEPDLESLVQQLSRR